MIDKTEIECRFRKSVDSYEENAHVQKTIVNRLMALLKKHCHTDRPRILEIGCGTGLLTAQLCREYKDGQLMINDLVDQMCVKAATRYHIPQEHCIPGDIETVPLEREFDLIASASTFQWLEQPAATLNRLAEHIAKEGWLVFSTFGKDNLKELKTITGKGLVYHSTNEMSTLLSSRFEVLYSEEEHYILEFNDPLEILKHIKKTGVNATNQQQIWTRGKINEFSEQYTSHFKTGESYPLTYHPQYFICRKRESAK